MDKILVNNLNVKYFENLLKKNVVNNYIQKIQALEKFEDGIKIKIKGKESNFDLIVCNGAIFITKYNYETSEKKAFIGMLNSIFKNEKIITITQKNLEKIIIFETAKNYLIFELFSHNNIILTDKNYNIIGCLYKEVWDKREIKPGKEYLFPHSDKSSPLKVGNYLDLKELIGKTNVPPSLVEFLYKKDGNLEAVGQKLKEIYKVEILRNACFLIKTKKLEYFPVTLEETEKINKSLNDVLDDYFYSYVDTVEETKDSKKVRELTTTLKKMDEKIEEFKENISKYNDSAKWIEQNYNQIEEVKAAVERGLSFNKNPKEIMDLLNNFKNKYPIIGQINIIDLKNKKIIFSIPQNQQ